MRRYIAILLIVIVMFSGCSGAINSMDKAIALRNELLSSKACSFISVITADYGDKIYEFKVQSNVSANGDLTFEVIEPDSICGIVGKISDSGGQITFDEQVLMFETLADGEITPVCAPWLFIRALRSGYINACGKDGDGVHIQIDDSYCTKALQVDIWTDVNNKPIRCEFFWEGRRIVSIDVVDFVIV